MRRRYSGHTDCFEAAFVGSQSFHCSDHGTGSGCRKLPVGGIKLGIAFVGVVGVTLYDNAVTAVFVAVEQAGDFVQERNRLFTDCGASGSKKTDAVDFQRGALGVGSNDDIVVFKPEVFGVLQKFKMVPLSLS